MNAIVEPLKSHKIYFALKEQIAFGNLRPGTRLAGEPDLAAMYGVSRVTVRRALENLEREGLIRRRPGAGTFVTDASAPRVINADLSDLLGLIAAMGRNTGVRLRSFDYVVPPAPVAKALGLARGEKAQRSVRVRLIDKEPFSYLSTWVPEPIGRSYSETDLASTPLLALLERSGVEVDRATQSIRATLAGPEVADALGIEIGASLLAVQRVVMDRAGRGVEFLDALYRPDRYQLTFNLVREGSKAQRGWRVAHSSGAAKPNRRQNGSAKRRAT